MNIYIILTIAVIIIIIIIMNMNKSSEFPKIDTPLSQSGIKPLGTSAEHFEDSTTSTTTNIIFDDIEKIMNNFDTFASIYFPKLDLARINDKLKTDKYALFTSIYNKTIQQILTDASTNQKSRERFKLKPIIDIYSRILLNDTSDANIDKNFELAMIGLIIFLNAKSANRQFTTNDYKSGSVVYEYNPDYATINELRIFMSTPFNKGKELSKNNSLTVENKECIVDKLCYTTSEDLKSFYMTSTKTKKEEKEKEDKNEREKKKNEVKTQAVDYNELLDFLFIANLIYVQDTTKENINAIVNDLFTKTFSDKKIRYRGLLHSIINTKNVEIDTEDK